jgi:hypothetical protein
MWEKQNIYGYIGIKTYLSDKMHLKSNSRTKIFVWIHFFTPMYCMTFTRYDLCAGGHLIKTIFNIFSRIIAYLH